MQNPKVQGNYRGVDLQKMSCLRNLDATHRWKHRVRPIGFYITCWCDPLFLTAPPILSKLAGPIFETKNRAIFSGELFLGEEFREKHYLSTTLFPLIGCGVDSYLPELEHL